MKAMKNGRLQWMMGRSRSSPDIIGRIQKAHRELSDGVQRINNTDRSVDWIDFDLLNGWVWYGADDTAAFSRTSNGIVRVKGLIKNGAIPSVVAYFPVGFRPTGTKRIPIMSNGSLAYSASGSDGSLWIYTGSNAWVDLSAISFRAEQ